MEREGMTSGESQSNREPIRSPVKRATTRRKGAGTLVKGQRWGRNLLVASENVQIVTLCCKSPIKYRVVENEGGKSEIKDREKQANKKKLPRREPGHWFGQWSPKNVFRELMAKPGRPFSHIKRIGTERRGSVVKGKWKAEPGIRSWDMKKPRGTN